MTMEQVRVCAFGTPSELSPRDYLSNPHVYDRQLYRATEVAVGNSAKVIEVGRGLLLRS